MAEFRSIKDVFRDPLIVALVLVGTTGVVAAVVGSLLSNYQEGSERIARNKSTEYAVVARRHETPIHAVGLSGTGYHGAKHPSTGDRRN